MRYTATERRFEDSRYHNTTQHHAARVVVTPSIDTARTALTACYVNLTIGVNTQIYLQKIAAILAAYPELATPEGVTSCNNK